MPEWGWNNNSSNSKTQSAQPRAYSAMATTATADPPPPSVSPGPIVESQPSPTPAAPAAPATPTTAAAAPAAPTAAAAPAPPPATGNHVYNPSTGMYSVWDGKQWNDKSRADLGAGVLNSQPGWAWDEQEIGDREQYNRKLDFDVGEAQKMGGLEQTTTQDPQFNQE